MSVFVARQAILNRNQNVVAYELLFRDSPENCFPGVSDGQLGGGRTRLGVHRIMRAEQL